MGGEDFTLKAVHRMRRVCAKACMPSIWRYSINPLVRMLEGGGGSVKGAAGKAVL